MAKWEQNIMEALLSGDARYAASTVAPLEKLLEGGAYSLEGSLALLKLYQLHPASLNKVRTSNTKQDFFFFFFFFFFFLLCCLFSLTSIVGSCGATSAQSTL